MSNGTRELLFDMLKDPEEKNPIENAAVLEQMRNALRAELAANEQTKCMVTEKGLVSYSYREREFKRIKQFDSSKGIKDFTVHFGIEKSNNV